MFGWKFAPYLRGYVIIKVRGRSLERFVNLAAASGVNLYDVQKVGGQFLIARVEARDLKILWPLGRRVDCKISVEKRAGLPFLIVRLRGRMLLVAGAVIFCCVLYILSSYVWFIEVRGLTTLDKDRILRIVRAAGITPGTRKSRVDEVGLERELLRNIREIVWAGVTVRGTLLNIEVVEKVLPEERAGSVVDVVAAKGGVVVKFIPLAGEPLVKEGNTVSPGQTLIRGIRSGDKIVDARGIVEAKVWYEAKARVPLVLDVVRRTGNKKTIRIVRVRTGDGSRLIIGKDKPSFRDFEKEVVTSNLRIKGVGGIPVELITIVYYEVERQRRDVPFDQAVCEARGIAWQSLLKQFSSGSKALGRKEGVRSLIEDGKNMVEVTLTVEVQEDIAKPKRVRIRKEMRT